MHFVVENRYLKHKLFAPLDQVHPIIFHKWGRGWEKAIDFVRNAF
jgi:hypothetical protein